MNRGVLNATGVMDVVGGRLFLMPLFRLLAAGSDSLK